MEHRKPITVRNLLAGATQTGTRCSNLNTTRQSIALWTGLKSDRQEILGIGFRDFDDWFFVISAGGGAQNWTEGDAATR